MGGLADNLAAGLEAVRFVKGKMRLGAKNKVSDLVRSGGDSISCVESMRDMIAEHAETLQDEFERSQSAANERLAAYTASAAALYGCGNCDEQAALAFIYLRDRGVFPLDWIDKANVVLKFGGHSFVVIGRLKGKINPADWGPDAVICDPHGEETAFAASEIEQYMPRAKLVGKLRMDAPTSSTMRVAF